MAPAESRAVSGQKGTGASLRPEKPTLPNLLKRTGKRALRKAKTGLLDLLYPPKCPLCGKLLPEGEQTACRGCLLDLPILTVDPDCGEFLAACVSPFRYTGTLRESLLRFKFGGRQQYARFYASYLAASVEKLPQEDCALVTWVPISRRRRLERGYDQAQLLAQETARQLGLPCVRCLKKIKHNKRQSRISDAAQRKANVKGVYRAFRPERFRGKRLLLIDDILTTGATLSECAWVLRAAGAEQVSAATAASAQRESSQSSRK